VLFRGDDPPCGALSDVVRSEAFFWGASVVLLDGLPVLTLVHVHFGGVEMWLVGLCRS